MSKLVNKLKIFSPDDSRDYTLKAVGVEKQELPEEYMPEKRIPITNQFWSSMCASHTLATVMSYGELKAGLEPNIFSKGRIYADRNGQNTDMEGMYTRDAIKILQKEGDCPHHYFRWHMSDIGTISYAYQHKEEELNEKSSPYKIKSYGRLYADDDIKTAVLKFGAVVLCYPMYKSNDTYINPPKEGEKSSGSHAITLIGWTKDYWVLQNSWGKSAGDHGLFYMSKDYPWREAWFIEVNPNTPRDPAPTGDCINDFFHDIKEFFCGLIHWCGVGIEKLRQKLGNI